MTMHTGASTDSTDPFATRIGGLRDELRAAIAGAADPQAKALLETAAEVLGGLRKAFVDYAEGSEVAWQR
jgi:hypothetical protein